MFSFFVGVCCYWVFFLFIICFRLCVFVFLVGFFWAGAGLVLCLGVGCGAAPPPRAAGRASGSCSLGRMASSNLAGRAGGDRVFFRLHEYIRDVTRRLPSSHRRPPDYYFRKG